MHSLIKVNYTTLGSPCGEAMWHGVVLVGKFCLQEARICV